MKYISWSGIVKALKWRISQALKPNSSPKIFWVGPFSPIHSNVGDHAQTLGVQKFLEGKFGDYKIIRIYRDDITIKVLTNIANQLRPFDFIFLHSSGDFGSLHDVDLSDTHLPGRISFPEVRRQIVSMAPNGKIINLPTTAYYEENDRGAASLKKDQAVFNGSKFNILCREEASLQLVRENLTCRSSFFPDFVFYLEPRPSDVPRDGVQVILREDKEADLSKVQRKTLIAKLGALYANIHVEDILNEGFVITDFILDKYINSILRKFQRRELIITDKMHGMIIAVITQTPCIALSGGIPHKIKAYEPFLSAVVEFVDHPSQIEEAVQRLRNCEYVPVDLTEYFDRFRGDIAHA